MPYQTPEELLLQKMTDAAMSINCVDFADLPELTCGACSHVCSFGGRLTFEQRFQGHTVAHICRCSLIRTRHNAQVGL